MNTPFLARMQGSKLVMLAAAGGVVLAGGMVIAPDRTWNNLLVAAYFLLTIALGGAVFVALTYVTGAGWHVAFRRIPEAMARILPFAGVALLVVLALRMTQYAWHDHSVADGHGGTASSTFWFKEFWLSPWFWMSRAAGYIAAWWLFSGLLLARSRKQDVSGNGRISSGNVRLSALFLAIYAVTFTLASVDWIMALEPMWFSTIWGVYQFAGMIQAALAVAVILVLLYSSRGGPLHEVCNQEHLHDLGKLLLGFSCFWMYIWFSQYMLIWYSNIPEETAYFAIRARGPWSPVLVVSLLLNWGIPFFVLLPRSAKRNGQIMMRIAIVVLVGRWIDLYLMVFPATYAEGPVFGIWEVAAIGCLVGTAAALLHWSFAQANPVPDKDPYLAESVHYHAG